MKKNNKKNKNFQDLDYKFEEYDEEEEKEEINEGLRYLQNTFSLSDDEMTKLLNYDFENEDLKDIDKLASILLNIYNTEEEEEEDKKEFSNPANNENINKEKTNKLDIESRSKLNDLFYSIENEKKYNKNSTNINEDCKPRKSKKKKFKFVGFEEAKDFLKEHGNEKKIDLHDFTLVQSMYIIDEMINSLTKEKYYHNLKEIELTIITGPGNHSKDHKPILHPQLAIYLRGFKKVSVDEKSNPCDLYVKIY